MNTDEYKLFISKSRKVLENNKTSCLDNPDIYPKTIFYNYDLARKRAANFLQRNINNIEDLVMVLDKNLSDRGIRLDWSLNYNSLNDSILKELDTERIKSINIIESNFTQELGLKRFLGKEGIDLEFDNKDTVIIHSKFSIASSGSFFLEFNNLNEMNMFHGSKNKIIILPFNTIIRNLSQFELLAKLFYSNRDGRQLSNYSTIYTPNNENTIVYIIDNGRSSLLANAELRKALTCLDCDACKKVCPIYSLTGPIPYNNSLSGPYANIVLPYFENIDAYKHLSYNCVLCGNCSAICPVNIPLKNLIINNRNYFYEQRYISVDQRRRMRILKKYLVSRKNLDSKSWKKTSNLHLFISQKNKRNRVIPKISNQTYSQKFELAKQKREV